MTHWLHRAKSASAERQPVRTTCRSLCPMLLAACRTAPICCLEHRSLLDAKQRPIRFAAGLRQGRCLPRRAPPGARCRSHDRPPPHWGDICRRLGFGPPPLGGIYQVVLSRHCSDQALRRVDGAEPGQIRIHERPLTGESWENGKAARQFADKGQAPREVSVRVNCGRSTATKIRRDHAISAT